jgi:hypothetical protein
MSHTRAYVFAFNKRLPPLFKKGGLLDRQRPGSPVHIGAKVRFMVEMPEGHFPAKEWLGVYRSARQELMELVFMLNRSATKAELSQLEWLRESGHSPWTADKENPRCDLYNYIEQLEARVKELEEKTK